MKLLVRRFLSSVLVAAATVVSRRVASVGPGIRPGAVCRLPDRFILGVMRLFRSRVAVALVAVATFAAVSVPAIGAAEVRERVGRDVAQPRLGPSRKPAGRHRRLAHH